MSATANDLLRIAADLRHAAGAGGQHLVHQVVADGRAEAELGAAVSMPGAGLSELLAHSGKAGAQADAVVDVGPVLDHMEGALLDGGLDLALGRRR